MVICLSLVSTLCGQQPGQASSSDGESIAEPRSPDSITSGQSVDWLSQDQYSKRQQATLQMWRDREETRDQVQEAARHPDPEISGRANWILRQWRRGVLPTTPIDIAKLLQSSSGPTSIERLLDGGQFNAVLVAVEESAGTADRESIQTRICSALRRRFPIYVHFASRQQSIPELLRLVDLVADSKELALCRLGLMLQLGMEIQADNLLPASASLWSPRERQQAETLMWIMLGQEERAAAIARQSVEPDLLHQCRMIAGRWAEAADDAVKLARRAESGQYEYARLWCLTLIAADRSDQDELRREAIDALTSIGVGAPQETELRWKCLVSHGEVERALELVATTNPDKAASICIDASRSREAFKALDYPLDRIDLDLESWVDQAFADQRQFAEADLTPAVRRIIALMKCLMSIGRDDAAWFIAKKIVESDIKIGQLHVREYLLLALTTTRRSDWVLDLAVRRGETELSDQSKVTISRVLPDCDTATLGILLQWTGELMPLATLRERVQAIARLCDGELPHQFDRVKGFQSLFDLACSPSNQKRRSVSSWGRKVILANLDIVALFAKHGEVGFARQCLQMLAQNNDANAIFFLAERELDGGRTDIAEALFDRVFDIVGDRTRGSGRFAGSADVSLAVKAKIGLWIIARRNGDVLGSRELEHEIRLALCSPSMRLRISIAEYLGDRQETELAMEIFEGVFPITVFGTDEQTSLYDAARSYAPLARQTKPKEAARWFDLAVNGTLDSVDFRPGAYVTLPLFIRRWAIEEAIKSEDSDEVQRHLDRIVRLDPLDIDFAERLLPEMRKRGMTQLADRMLDQMIDRGLEYGRDYPFDAMTCNNLAWVAAMNQRRLGDALQLAQIAVAAEPESATYRDTLAEVLFLLGRKREALQIEQSCLLDDPGQWHLHEQIEKYSQAMVQSTR